MELEYKSKKLREQCTDFGVAKRKMSLRDAKGLMKTITFMEAATSMHDVIEYAPFHFHPLKGDKKGLYAIDINGRRSSYRLILKQSNNDKRNLLTKASTITVIMIWEVSNHYE